MLKSIFIILLFFTTLSASYIKNIWILEMDTINTSIEDIRISNNFKKITLPFIQHSKKSYFIKFILDEGRFQNEDYIISFNSFLSQIRLENNDIFSNNMNGFSPLILLRPNDISKTFFLKLENNKAYINLDIKVSSLNDYLEEQTLKKIFHGFSYGIIFASFLLYLVFYFFNQKKSYLFCSLTQLMILGMLIVEINIFDKNYEYVIIILFYLFSLFSNLFVQYFFHTKKEYIFLDKILKLVILINTLHLFIVLVFDNNTIYDYIPYSTSWSIYLLLAMISLFKGNKASVFFLLAWAALILSSLTIEVQLLYLNNELIFNAENLVYFVLVFESILILCILPYKFKILKNEYIKQREIIYHQNKLASMGEMIENISHQWKQPLTQLSFIIMAIKTAFNHNKLSLEYLENKTEEASNQLRFMSNTITDFSNFLSLKKEKESFFIVDEINRVISLIQDSFTFFSITLEVNCDENHLLRNYKGELSHVIFNLLNNAKDAFSKKKIKNAKIIINIKKDENNLFIFIEDNAGGVNPKIEKKIFEPYFTTKENGLGIGLYMSKKIIEESILGKLTYENKENGAKFCIFLPLSPSS